MLTIGPRRISHRDRAVSAQDFEELALEASRQVAKARCLTATNLVRAGTARRDPCDAGQRHTPLGARGWVSLIVVPDSTDARPWLKCVTRFARGSITNTSFTRYARYQGGFVLRSFSS